MTAILWADLCGQGRLARRIVCLAGLMLADALLMPLAALGGAVLLQAKADLLRG